jgi:quinol monooxygenase YgiN
MFAIAGRLECAPENHDEAAAAMVTMMEETAKEEGCQAYRFTADLSQRGVFYIFELWDSDEALKAHFAAEHMAAFQAAYKACGPTGGDALRYDVSNVGPLRRPR